ncbi:MAG: aminopeptidase N C-terminal domain-containing protein [Candidatus Pacebacteria bacterium]|jgi:aminopeptidase N|nr:aminopeptidase N C-terminal domain-containing protein [Candidatus Paceibacterota bacterium]
MSATDTNRSLPKTIAMLTPYHPDGINPQVAARLARCFDRWRRLEATRQAHARAAPEMLRNHKGLSRDVFEIVERSLG